MASATFRKGQPKVVDYTPSADLSAGDVVLLGNSAGITCGVVQLDMVNAATNACIAVGGGIYDIISLQNTANNVKVYWDPATPTKVTTTSTNNALFGFIVEGGGLGANTIVSVLHHPYV